MEKEFYTTNLDLAAFLLLEGEDFIGLINHPTKTNVIKMGFKDPIGRCLDLERVFINSQYKKYREYHRWLLQKIHTRIN